MINLNSVPSDGMLQDELNELCRQERPEACERAYLEGDSETACILALEILAARVLAGDLDAEEKLEGFCRELHELAEKICIQNKP